MSDSEELDHARLAGVDPDGPGVGVGCPVNARSVPAWRRTAYPRAGAARATARVGLPRQARPIPGRREGDPERAVDRPTSPASTLRALTRRTCVHRAAGRHHRGNVSGAPVPADPAASRRLPRLINPLGASASCRPIEEVRPETDDAATLVIRPGWGWRYDHRAERPGQSRHQGPGRRAPVALVTVNSRRAGTGRTITITVRAMPEGKLSSHLVNGLDGHDRRAGAAG